MFSMALLSTFLLTFFGAGGPDLSPSSEPGIGGGSNTLALCGSTSPGRGGEEEDEPVDLCKLTQIPKVWIGVRVSTVPDALAAHLKRGSLMIVNVAEDSPAERAGIDRYDAVLSFNDREIREMQDLLEAIRENGADKPARMVVIKGGEEKTHTITPIQRDLTVTPTFKYEEQELAEVDPLEKYFGHRLKLGPDGSLIFTPQGRLDRLPDDIKRLLDAVPDFERDFPDDLPSGFSIDFDYDLPDFEFFIDAKEIDESSPITITITGDGKSMTIQRDEDGNFTVERQDADGKRTSKSYDDADQFRVGDPPAYRIYRKSTPHRGFSTIILPPDLRNLGDRQHEFEIELKTKLDQARKQAEETLEEDRKKIEIHRHKIESHDEDDTTTHTKVVTLSIDDGRITLTIVEDGATREYEFDSREEFEKSEPELYEQYRSYLDE